MRDTGTDTMFNIRLTPRTTFLAPGLPWWGQTDGRWLRRSPTRSRSFGHRRRGLRFRRGRIKLKVAPPVCNSVDDYNRHLAQADSAALTVLIYKGNHVKRDTVESLRRKTTLQLYPDLSFPDHGANIPRRWAFMIVYSPSLSRRTRMQRWHSPVAPRATRL